MEKINTYPFYIKTACVLISLVLLLYIGVVGQVIIVPMLLGALISVLLVPYCRFFERKLYFSRSLAAVFVIVVFLAFISAVFLLLGSQFRNLAHEWPAFEEQLVTGVHNVQLWVQGTFGIGQNEQMSFISNHASETLSTGTGFVTEILNSVSVFLMYLMFTFLYAIFILIYRRHLVKFLVIYFKRKHRGAVLIIVLNIQRMVKRYLVGLLMQMILVFALTFLAYTVLGVKYGFMLAVLTAILNVLPYIGIFTALIVGVLVTFATGSAGQVLLVVGAIGLIHVIDGNIIMPKIVGSKVKVNSLAVVIGLVIGHMMWGISGMLLAIPVLAITKIILNKVDGMRAWGFLLGEGDNEVPVFHISMVKLLKGKHRFPDKDDIN